MTYFLYVLIGIFGISSYVVGVSQMLKNKYSPSTFSRVIWLLLAINAFAGIVLGNASTSSILLGGIFLLGNALVCIVSFWKGTKLVGNLEYFCIVLLAVSGGIWIFFDAPLLNVSLSLFAYFVGALPTYKKVWYDPKSESIGFWSLFFIASALSIVATDSFSLEAIIFPIYFTLFDGSMTLLSLRKLRETK